MALASNTSIMSIREMIDTAFGDQEANVVNHKLIQAILYLLARQLRILERRVEVDLIPNMDETSSTSLLVTEVKILANIPKKSNRRHSTKMATDEERNKINIPFVTKSAKRELLHNTIGVDNKDGSMFIQTDIEGSVKAAQEKSIKTSTQKSSAKDYTELSDLQRSSQEYHNLLEKIEEQREKQLRIIHQRADSREVRDKTPTPMASLDTMEKQYEKLLIVERVPTKETKAAAERYHRDSNGQTPRLSIVTQEEFSELAAEVDNIQTRLLPIASADFPDNIKLMQDLRKGASLTDAMAALQLSARLEGVEKILQKMTSLVTELASQPPGLEKKIKTALDIKETEGLFDAPEIKLQTTSSRSNLNNPLDQPPKRFHIPSERDVESTTSQVAPETASEHEFKIKENWITAKELETSLQKIHDEFLKTVASLTTQSTVNADNALKIAKKLQLKLDASLNLDDRMNDLENLVSEYSEQINILDTNVSSQMTNYQEQLTQMQHNLEAGLEAMAESLVNVGGDTAAVTELNTQFTNLQIELDTANMRLKDLKDNQEVFSMDLQHLWKQIELLRDTKSDREEIADALRDKAGLGALNGLVTLQQFNAIKADFEKRISIAYDKFSNQEIVWQKAIDDLVEELNEKADWIQVVSLRDDINKNLEKLRSRIHAMMEILGEPQAAAVSRRIFRDTACLSCSTPAHMKLEEHGVLALPAFPKSRPDIGTEAPTKLKEDGDHKHCHTDLPVSHPIDTKLQMCHRYCGGSHTILPTSMKRAPPNMIKNSALRQVTTAIGSDSDYKICITDKGLIKKPRLPCNQKDKTPESSIDREDLLPVGMVNSDVTAIADCLETSLASFQRADIVSVTPPLLEDD